MIKLPEQRRCGNSHFVFPIVQRGQASGVGTLGALGANANALTAVNTALRADLRLAVAHANGFGRAALNAGGAPDTFFFI